MKIDPRQNCLEIEIPKMKECLRIPFNLLDDKGRATLCIATYLVDLCKSDLETSAIDKATAAAICWVGAEKIYEELEERPEFIIFRVMNS